jgi:hypothetical protein
MKPMVDMNKPILLIVILVASIALIQPTVANSETTLNECSGDVRERTVTQVDGKSEVKYEVGYDEETRIVCVSAENTGELKAQFAVSIGVDGRPIPINKSTELNPGDSVVVKRNVTTWLNATADDHRVSVGTFGPNYQFNFTEEINESNEEGIPTPVIKNVTVVDQSGDADTLLKVAIVNRANRTYAPSVFVKTSETPSVPTLGTWSSDDVEIHTAHLNERGNETIVGSVQLYYKEGMDAGKFDKKEFVVYPNGSADLWDKRFEEVPSLREVNGEKYYQNQSALRFRGEGPEANPEARQAGRVAAVAGMVLVGVLAWFRYR